MFRFNKMYFLLFLILFWFEVLIALFVHDRFVRPYVGDALVVTLLYCFTRSLLNIQLLPALFLVVSFAFAVETAQYFSLVHHLGLQDYPLATTLIGTSFDWQDLLAYTIGGAFVFLLEQLRARKTIAGKQP